MRGNSGPFDITAGPDGNLWFTEIDEGNRIGRITPSGAITEFSRGIRPGGGPTEIAGGPDGNLWFTEYEGNRVGRITPEGAIVEFSDGITPHSGPAGIATGPDGNLWFTEAEGNRIGRITPAGEVTEFSRGISPESGPAAIAAGPDGNLWFTERWGYRIGRITPAGVVTEFSAGRRPRTARYATKPGPGFIAAGPDGNLWFTEDGGHRIGRITPAGVVTMFPAGLGDGSPCGIAAGPDGNLWFTEAEGDRIGRITPAGATTLFRGPSAYVHHETSDETWYSRCGIASGPDGNVWFTEWEADRIGRITPQGVISEFPPTAALGAIRPRGRARVGVQVRCPAGAARDCRGTVRLTSVDLFPERLLGVSRLTVAPGRRAEILVRLWAPARRRVRRYGAVVVRAWLVPSARSTAGAVWSEPLTIRRPRRQPAVAG
jgi:streptogramin lyase